MTKADVMKIALDLANVLMDAGDEMDEIINSATTEKLVADIKQLIKDIEGE